MAQSEVQPFVLGISTSSGIAQVCALRMPEASASQAMWVDFPVLFDFEITEYKQQSLELLPLLLGHMALAGLTGEGCKGIACNIGPGGFTSLRTACGVAQGLATAWNCGVLPVSSFECMAAEFVLRGGDFTQALACFMDARLQEFYAAGLSWPHKETSASAFELLGNPGQIKANAVAVESYASGVTSLKEGLSSSILIDPAAYKILQEMPGFEMCQHWSVVNPSARGLAVLGVLAVQACKLQEPFALQPLYVREKVAQTTSERLAARDVSI